MTMPTPLTDPYFGPPGAADRFAVEIAALRLAMSRGTEGLVWALNTLLHRRLGRIMARFADLVEQIRGGGLRQPRVRISPPAKPERATTRPPPLFKRGRGWLAKLVGKPAALCGSGMYSLLSEREMEVLIAAAPKQMWRIIGPLMHMLGWELPPNLTPPPKPKRVRKAVANVGDAAGPRNTASSRRSALEPAEGEVSDEERYATGSLVGDVPGGRRWPGWTRWRRRKRIDRAGSPSPGPSREGRGEEKPL